jgi:AraC-like DNA-binding protein
MQNTRTDQDTALGSGTESAGLNDEALCCHPRLSRVRFAFVPDPSQPISLDCAARLAGLEPHYFCTLFHAVAGIRFKQWVTHVRIRAAHVLLLTTGRTITDIAFEVGYNDLRSFERAFLRDSGSSPVQFRRSGSRQPPALRIERPDHHGARPEVALRSPAQNVSNLNFRRAARCDPRLA